MNVKKELDEKSIKLMLAKVKANIAICQRCQLNEALAYGSLGVLSEST